MFSHITVGTSDLEKAAGFYDALLAPLGLIQRPVIPDGGPSALCWVLPQTSCPRFFVTLPFNGTPARAGNGVMVAFLAPSNQAVDKAYKAGMGAGATCEGKPGARLHYAADYYGAYLRDLDGNKIHIVHRAGI